LKHLPDFIMIFGASLLSYGAWLVYEPAGAIVFGMLSLIAGVKMAGK